MPNRNLGFRGRMRGWRPTLRRQIIYTHPDLVAFLERSPGQDENLAMAMVSDHNVARVHDYRPSAESEKFARFLAEGRTGVFAMSNGRVVGHAWMTPRHVEGTALGYLKLEPGQVLIHHCNVAGSHRGRRIFAQMVQFLVGVAISENSQIEVVIDTSRSNSASRSAIEAMGFRPAKSGWFLQIGSGLVLHKTTTRISA